MFRNPKHAQDVTSLLRKSYSVDRIVGQKEVYFMASKWEVFADPIKFNIHIMLENDSGSSCAIMMLSKNNLKAITREYAKFAAISKAMKAYISYQPDEKIGS